ncbi:hypothetical protein Y026_5249 [Burkholderia pseudomallei TSV28]|nr:hypothetical protein Y026_5249 [Burkholderia pseudomallei TSV28]
MRTRLWLHFSTRVAARRTAGRMRRTENVAGRRRRRNRDREQKMPPIDTLYVVPNCSIGPKYSGASPKRQRKNLLAIY